MGLVLLGGPVAAAEPDFARETRLDEQIRDAIFDGEPIDLEAAGRSFLAIDMVPDAEPSRGAVILMHGRGFHPDWQQVAGPLRVSLAEAGWRTLSIQMPVLAKDARYYDYEPVLGHAHDRIRAAMAYLREQGESRVTLVAHSCSVHMVMDYVRAGGEGFDALVGIGMGATDYGQPMREPLPLDRVTVPVLDVRGADDFPAVHRLAPRRLAAMQKAGNARSAQVVVPDTDHYFEGAEDALHDVVSNWLSALDEGG